MRRWLFAGLVSLVVAALLVWQWRAAEPLDLTDAAVRHEFRPPLPPIDTGFAGSTVSLDDWLTPHSVVIGHWEYTAVRPALDRTGLGRPLRVAVEVHKRPVTLIARLRAALGAD